MGKKKIGGVLSVLAVTWFLLGQSAAGEVASNGQQVGMPEILPDGIYLVRDRDTLWAIAGRYLDDPRLWPKIWKQNPFVADPHKIFPGDPVAIPGLTPSPKQVAGPPPVPKEELTPPAAPAAEAPPLQVAELKRPEEEIRRRVAPPPPIIPRPALECSGFVAERSEIHQVGLVIRPLEEHERLWYGDQIFLDLGGRKVKRGDRFQVIRPTKTIRHPATGAPMGIKVRMLGTVEIVSAAGQAARARIVYNCEDITVGDALVEARPWAAPALGLSHPTDIRVGGYIIGSKDDADSLGKGDVVYVDVGRARRIVPGDEFSIYRMSGIAVHPETGQAIPLAPVKQGELVIIRTSARTAAAILTRSDLNLHVGERIVLLRKMP
ncbi:MAG: LysM peptidoglycan-binding domain-containing protein [Candidatus Methylomirabilales bacterium]